VQAKIHPGARIAVAVGSRGIANIATIVQTAVTTLRRYGAEPFIVPAMGSHGGATPEGQRSLLESLGVTTEAMGAPIVSSLAVDQLGTLANGLPVHIDREAHNLPMASLSSIASNLIPILPPLLKVAWPRCWPLAWASTPEP